MHEIEPTNNWQDNYNLKLPGMMLASGSHALLRKSMNMLTFDDCRCEVFC